MQDQSYVEVMPPQPQAPPPAPWGIRALAGGFALSILLYLVGSLLGALLIRAFGLEESPYLGVVLGLIQFSMVLPPLFIMRRYGSLVTLLGLNRFHWRMLLETVLAIALGFSGSILWGLFLVPFGLRPQEPIVPLFGQGIGSFVSVFAVGAILAPIVEEVLFRGFLFAGLRKYLNLRVAVLASGALFGALHFQLYAFPVLFMLGVLLALLYYRTGSLLMPILMHFCINAIAIVAQYFALQNGLI